MESGTRVDKAGGDAVETTKACAVSEAECDVGSEVVWLVAWAWIG